MSRSIRELSAISVDKPEVIRVSKQYVTGGDERREREKRRMGIGEGIERERVGEVLIVNRFDTSPTLRQEYMFMPMKAKHTYLVYLLRKFRNSSIIVFVPSIQ